jgi:hypothetical protein
MLQIRFKTDRFQLSGILPEEINAGNQFYGEDLARWLCDALPEWKLGYMDEDWGWLVFSKRETTPENERNAIGIYAYPPDEAANDGGEWMITVATEQRRPWLRFLWQAVPFNRQLGADVLAALEAVDVRDLQTSEGP